MNALDDVHNGRRLATVRQIPGIPGYGWLTEPALRHLIFNAQNRLNSRGEKIAGNGLGRAVLRIGRKILVDLDGFDSWLDEHRQDAGQGGDE